MFFALAIQLYESTLISTKSPFDLSAVERNGVPEIDLKPSTGGNQHLPHRSLRSVSHRSCSRRRRLGHQRHHRRTRVARLSQRDPGRQHHPQRRGPPGRCSSGARLIDTGFSNNGVTPDDADVGLNGHDPFGNPLSFSEQFLQYLAGNAAGVVDPYVEDVRPCDLELSIARNIANLSQLFFTQVQGVVSQSQGTTNCFTPVGAFVPTQAAALAELQSPSNVRMKSAARNSFKIPTLRNIELTGPFMHNGGMAKLEQVIEFYTRGGTFRSQGKPIATIFPLVDLRFDPAQRQALLDFLLSLTNDRVRYERAPFDHPALSIPNGDVGTTSPRAPAIRSTAHWRRTRF